MTYQTPYSNKNNFGHEGLSLPNRPSDAQLHFNGRWFKIGLHGFVFVWTVNGQWRKYEDFEDFIKDRING